MRLVDCYMDAFAYTLYLLRGNGQGAHSYEKAREEILSILDSSTECARIHGFKAEQAQDAKFAVCAWIDEVVLTSSWTEAPEWKKLQLQREFFNTNNAGVEFFDRLEGFGTNQKMLREVYMLCLSLGFRGKYFHEDDQNVLESIKNQNLEVTLGDFAKEENLAGIKLFPEAYWGERKGKPSGAVYRPFDWLSLFIPIIAAIIAVELYLFYDNSLNIQLLQFFGAIK